MHRILNLNLAPQVPTVGCAEPDVRSMDLYGTSVAFDCNSLCAVAVNHDVAETLKTLKDEPDCRGYLYSNRKPQFKLYPQVHVRQLVLNVTHACNLACKYCFAAEYAERNTMDMETARQGVNLLDKNSFIKISFFGGEPLLAWELIQDVISYAEGLAAQRRKGRQFHITTNGTLITPEKARYLRQHNVSLLVSLDGPKQIHDAARPTKKDGGSFDLTMRGLRHLKDAGYGGRVMARATYSSTPAHLVARLRFFAVLREQGLISGVSIEPAIMSEGCGKGGEYGLDTLRKEYHEAAKWYAGQLRASLNGRMLDFFHFRKFLTRILYAQHCGTECGAGNGYITVGPDGGIFACHRETHTGIGHLDFGLDLQKRAKWRDNRIYSGKPCGECWARYLCGGGCRQAALELCGNIHERSEEHCEITRTIFKECLWIITQVDEETLRKHFGPPHNPRRRISQPKQYRNVSQATVKPNKQSLIKRILRGSSHAAR